MQFSFASQLRTIQERHDFCRGVFFAMTRGPISVLELAYPVSQTEFHTSFNVGFITRVSQARMP